MKRITWIQALSRTRRQFLKTVVAAVAFAVVGLTAHPAAFAGNGNEHWVGTWSSSPQDPDTAIPVSVLGFTDQTLRQIVHTSIGGDHVRVRFTNEIQATPLSIGAAHIALRDSGASIVPGSGRTLTFDGSPSIIVSPGAHVVSDPVDLDVPALADLAIDIYLPGPTGPTTFHRRSFQTTYISPAGNYTGAATLPIDSTTLSWFFLKGAEVMASTQTGAIVCLGDSITDGTNSTPDTNNRYPDHLARRILALHGNQKLGVLNQGIAGNRVVEAGRGPTAQARFDRDVLAQTGVTHVIVLEGINDSSNTVFQADRIIAGHHQMIERAHAKGLKIYGATLTPAGSTGTREANRQAVNAWIRTSGEYDAVIDFDEVTRDPNNPTFFLPIYDSGDHLHPNDAGYEAMADAIDLKLFK
jgi:lysophospholipase L1-like esterase